MYCIRVVWLLADIDSNSVLIPEAIKKELIVLKHPIVFIGVFRDFDAIKVSSKLNLRLKIYSSIFTGGKG